MNSLMRWIPGLLLLGCSGVVLGNALPEHTVKAAIAHKITKFVTWPEESFASASSPINFCVVDTGPLMEALQALEAHPVHGRQLKVRSLEVPREAAAGCDVLYLSQSAVANPSVWLNEIWDQPVLTFVDAEGRSRGQTIVSLDVRRNKVSFEINKMASEQAGLTIGAQLLQLAALSNQRGR